MLSMLMFYSYFICLYRGISKSSEEAKKNIYSHKNIFTFIYIITL